MGTATPSIDRSGMVESRSHGPTLDSLERDSEEAQLHDRDASLHAERIGWQGVVEGIADEVWVCDAEGRTRLVNVPAVRGTGQDEFVRGPNGEIADVEILDTDGSLRAADCAPLIRSLRGEVVRGQEIMRHRRTGGLRYREFSSAPMRNARGEITGAVAIVRDITESKRIEQALRESDRRKGEYLAMLSHELRNPLAPIRSCLEILERSEPGSEHASHARAVIERQVGHMTRLVDDLLEMSRIDRGAIELRRERLELCDLVGRTIEDHKLLFSSKGIELSFTTPDVPIVVDADPTRLAQAVGNILQNAAKFTRPGGRVSLTVAVRGMRATIQVRDNGVGISREILGRLFEPFAQADRSLDRTGGGLGLGLSVVKGLIELHGGEVSAASDGPGTGAEFVISLPAELEAERASSPGEASIAPNRVNRVLVIEDNVDAADSLKEVLELDGHEVAIAYNGREGVAAARSFGPDVILCDIGLPEMDGYEVARTLRADPVLANVKLVALTGYAGPDDKRRAAHAGFDCHLAKPADIETLERVLAGLSRPHAA